MKSLRSTGSAVAVRAAERSGRLPWNDGASVDDAMELGKAAGLTRLEPAVRTLLEANRGESP